MSPPPRTALRTAGIWIVDNHILLESLVNVDVWGIPGGRLEADESVFQGCLREYREEVGIEMRITGMALINENFYTDEHGRVREYCFYCLVQPQADDQPALVPMRSREAQLKFQWFRLEDVPRLSFVPTFLKTLLPRLSSQPLFVSTTE